MSDPQNHFYSLTPDRVLDCVEASGFRVTGRCMALNSFENRVYDIELEPHDENGPKSVVAKFYRPGRWSEAQLREEHAFMFDAVAAELPVVAPLLFPGGDSLKKTPEGIWYTVFPKRGGRASVELSDEQVQILGRLIARLHSVGSQRKSTARVVINDETYGQASLLFLKAGNWIPPHYLARYESAAQTICRTAKALLAQIKPEAMIRLHGDCHPGNLLWASSGPLFVDFDDMVVGPAVQDIWLILSGRDAEAVAQRELLIESYEQMRSFDRSTLKLIEPLRGLRIIHFSAWLARRWDDPAFPAAFPQFNTEAYWRDETSGLEELVDLLPGADRDGNRVKPAPESGGIVPNSSANPDHYIDDDGDVGGNR